MALTIAVAAPLRCEKRRGEPFSLGGPSPDRFVGHPYTRRMMLASSPARANFIDSWMSGSRRDHFALDRKSTFHHLKPSQLVVNLVLSATKAMTLYLEPHLNVSDPAYPPDLAAILSAFDVHREGPAMLRSIKRFFIKTLAQLSLQRLLEVPL